MFDALIAIVKILWNLNRFAGPSLESQNQSTNSLLKTPQHESKGLLNTAGKHRTVKENGSYQNILAHIASRHPVRSNLATESSNWDPKAVQVRSFKDLPSVTKSAAIDETEDAGKGVSQQGDYVIPMDGSKNVDRLDPNRRASVVRTKSLKGRSNSVKRTPSRKDVDPRQSVSTESPLAPRDFTAELTRTRSKRLMSIATTFEPDKIVATDAVELTGDVSLEISRVKTMKPDVLMSPRYSFAQSSSPEASYTNLVNTRQSLQVGGSQESPIPSRASVDIKDPNAAQSEAIIESVRRASTRLSVDFGTKGVKIITVIVLHLKWLLTFMVCVVFSNEKVSFIRRCETKHVFDPQSRRRGRRTAASRTIRKQSITSEHQRINQHRNNQHNTDS